MSSSSSSFLHRKKMMSPAEATFSKPYLVTMIKTSIKFVVSFSFLLSYLSLITISLKSSTSSYFPSFTLQIFSHSLDKNYMFLLCNGILVFLATNSGLIGGSSSDVPGEQFIIKNGTVRPPVQELPDKTETEVAAVAEQEVATEGSDNGLSIPEGENEDQDQDQDEEEQANGVLGVEEEEGAELMSAEELNKKCDEFIKKMKEEIKWESQLVMVR